MDDWTPEQLDPDWIFELSRLEVLGLWLDDLLLIGMDRREPAERRHAALVRAWLIVVRGEKRPAKRPKKKSGSDSGAGCDLYPLLVMFGEHRRTGETRGWPLARYAYTQRHDPHFEGVDLRADEETVVRRWAKRWNKKYAEKK